MHFFLVIKLFKYNANAPNTANIANMIKGAKRGKSDFRNSQYESTSKQNEAELESGLTE